MATRRRRWPQACRGGGGSGRCARRSGRPKCGRPGSSRWTGTRRAPSRRRWRRRATCWCRCRRMRRAIRCCGGSPRRWRRRGRGGSGICRRPGSTAIMPAAGSTRTRRWSRSTTASRWRVAAEAAWLATGLPVMVFRLAGIYGPGRSALDRVREGRAQRVVKPGQVFSRIHVDDIAGGAAGGDGAAGARGGVQRRRRRAGAAAGRDRLCGGAAGMPTCRRRCPSRRPGCRRWRGASTRNRSGCRTGGSARSSGSRCARPNYRDGLRAILGGG